MADEEKPLVWVLIAKVLIDLWDKESEHEQITKPSFWLKWFWLTAGVLWMASLLVGLWLGVFYGTWSW